MIGIKLRRKSCNFGITRGSCHFYLRPGPILRKMSQVTPPNQQLSSRLLKIGEGKVRHLLVYEAKIMDVINGPLCNIGKAVMAMFALTFNQAQTNEDRFKIVQLYDHYLTHFLAVSEDLVKIIGDQDILTELQTARDQQKINQDIIARAEEMRRLLDEKEEVPNNYHPVYDE